MIERTKTSREHYEFGLRLKASVKFGCLLGCGFLTAQFFTKFPVFIFLSAYLGLSLAQLKRKAEELYPHEKAFKSFKMQQYILLGSALCATFAAFLHLYGSGQWAKLAHTLTINAGMFLLIVYILAFFTALQRFTKSI